MTERFTVGVVGNPNCGKTTLFNALTGSKQHVGNWPGVTVERKVGELFIDEVELDLVDLPGTYSLDVLDSEVSIDERIARDFVHAREAELIVNIVDASNLERNLYLTAQLVEMRVPLLVVLNMMDVAAEKGMDVDAAVLSQALGCPVVAIVASRGGGIDALKRIMRQAIVTRPVPFAKVRYDDALEAALAPLTPPIKEAAAGSGDSPRWLATRLLEGDASVRALVGERISDAELHEICGHLADDVDILLADGRYDLAHALTSRAVTRRETIGRDLSERIDSLVLHRVLGIPIFLGVMYLMFMFTINIGGAFVDFFDQFTGTLVVDAPAALLSALGAPDWLRLVLADGLGGGVQVVATFIPIVAFLFLFLSMLEDSGYMARAAFVMDRFMRTIGLPGKSFVPLIVGFGCNVPAIMATRTLEQQRERILTILMTPFMSCGARLPVYALFAAAFFPLGGQNLVFGLYLIGIAVAILTGLIMKRTLLPGEGTPFLMELPTYHMPTLKGVGLRTLERTRGFVLRAGTVIVPMVLVLNMLGSVTTDGRFTEDAGDQSLLSAVGRSVAPGFSPMGLDAENWPATVGIFTGVLAKEAVVGTLDAIYSDLAVADAGELGTSEQADEDFSLIGGLGGALATIPANLGDALGTWGDPLGVDIGAVDDQQSAAQAQEVDSGTFGAMATRFDGTAGAFAYLLFILLYMPCTAALAAVYRETNGGWTLFVAGWTTAVAYGSATLFYQSATYSQHPLSSAGWILGLILALIFGVLVMRWWGQRERAQGGSPAHNQGV